MSLSAPARGISAAPKAIFPTLVAHFFPDFFAQSPTLGSLTNVNPCLGANVLPTTMRSALYSLAILTAATAQEAPPDHAARARELLKAPSAQQRAWGGWHATQSGVESLTPQLLRAFAEIEKETSRDYRLAQLAILDGLIALKANVPSPELGRIAAKHTGIALILIAHKPDDHEQLLATMLKQKSHNIHGAAIRNLLLSMRSKTLAPHLLDSLRLKLVLIVTDGPLLLRGSGSGSSGIGCGSFRVPEDFPPITLHKLESRAGDGCQLLIDGPYPVYHERETCAPGKAIGASRSFKLWSDANEQQLHYLSALLDIPHRELELSREMSRSVTYRKTGYLADAIAERESVHDRFHTIVADLVQANLLDPALERSFRLDLSVEINDERANKQTPLPRLPPRNIPGMVVIGDIAWHQDLAAARAEARRKGKPLLMHFGEDPGCEGCQLFARGPLRDPQVIAATADFVPVFIDTLKDKETTLRFGERYGSYPVLRVQDHGGHDLSDRLDGNPVAGKLSIEQVLALLKKGLTQSRKKQAGR